MSNDSSATPAPTDNPPQDLAEAARWLGRGSVLVVGDAMLDRYYYGEVTRISPEAPVPVLGVQREMSVPGGAANVLRNVTALGVSAAFVSVVGDDAAGSDLTALIGRQAGVEPWLLVQGGRVTTVKTRFVARGQHLLRADSEDPAPLHPKLGERLLRIACDSIAATTVTILSDYSKGVLGAGIAGKLIAAARAAGRPVLVDPRGNQYEDYAGADVIMPNRRELAAVTGLPVDSDEEIVIAAQALRHRLGFRAVLVTRSEHGLSLITETETWHFPAEALEVHDVAGAGDTVAATLAAGLAAKLPLHEAARLANVAAGIVVGKVGTAVARQDDIIARLSPFDGNRAKIVTLAAAVEQAERWRRRGWRIGFTNGRFDTLHSGHLHLLEQARAGCDRLIVAVNSDASIAKIVNGGRQPQRPRPQAERAANLACLSSVDLVCFFDETTPISLINTLHPDLLVKGSNHAADVVGAEMVRGWGGTVLLAELLPTAAGFGNGGSTKLNEEKVDGAN